MVKQLIVGKHVYLCTPLDPASELETFLAKVTASSYPVELHKELSIAGLVPKLRSVETCPGGVTAIRMDYLDPEDGWVPLSSFKGDWVALEGLADAALARLHQCLDGKAVHGDLHDGNVFVR